MGLIELTINKRTFKIHDWLKEKLDNIKKIQSKGWDAIFLIDGIEGSGKSTLEITCAWYLSDGKITLYNLCTGSKDAIEKLKNLPDGSVMMIDEGSLLFASNDAMKREQRDLIKILNVIRQKRMVLIITSPSFFRLNRYISVDRSRFLLHVYTAKDLERGRFSYFGEKKKRLLFELGKKNFNSYSKPKSNFVGRFVDFNPFGKDYLETKKLSLAEALEPAKKQKNPAQYKKEVRDEIILRMKKAIPIKTYGELAKALDIRPELISRLKDEGEVY